MLRIIVGWLWVCAVCASGAEPVRVDSVGDPLPPGAVCRIGSNRTHERGLNFIAMTPDASHIVTGGIEEGAIHVREPRTMREIAKIPIPPEEYTWAVAISEDGRRVAALVGPRGTESPDRTTKARVWGVRGARLLCDVSLPDIVGHRGEVAFVEGGRKLVVPQAQMLVIDIATAKVERTIGDTTSGMKQVRTIARGGLVWAYDSDKGRIVDTATGKMVAEEWHEMHEIRGIVHRMYSADGAWVVLATDRAVVRCRVQLPIATRANLRMSDPVSVAEEGTFWILAIDDAGRRCLCSGNQLASVLDFTDRSSGRSESFHDKPLAAGGFAREVGLLAFRHERSLGQFHGMGLFDMRARIDLVERAGVRFMEGEPKWSENDRTIRDDRTSWDATSGRWIEGKLSERVRWPRLELQGEWVDTTPSPDGKRVLVVRRPVEEERKTGLVDGDSNSDEPRTPPPILGIELRDAATGNVLRSLGGPDPLPTTVSADGLSTDGRIFAIDDEFHREVWHTTSGRKIAALPVVPRKDEYRHAPARLTPDGSRLLYRRAEGLTILDTRSANAHDPIALPADPNPPKRPHDISPDGRWAALIDAKFNLRFYDLHRREPAEAFPSGISNPISIRFSPDGSKVMVASGGGFVVVWPTPSTPSPFTALPADGFGKAWDMLKDPSAKAANESLERFARSGDAVVRFLAERIRPAEPYPAKELKALLTELGSVEYRRREAAEARLRTFREEVLSELELALITEKDPEVSTRLRRVIDRPQTGQLRNRADLYRPTDEALRQMRVVEILERIGTPEAWKCVEKLAKGAANSRVTEEAVSALSRRR